MIKQSSRLRTHLFTEDQIRVRAYDLWRARGSVGGSPEDDWQTAIDILRIEKSPIRRLKKSCQVAFNENNRAFSLDVIKTSISVLGLAATALAGFGLYITYNTAQKQHKLDSERLVTDRFSKAVEQLGSQDADVRIGGIYSLERTAKDSSEDYETIMNVLAAFVRNKSPLNRKFDNKYQQVLQITTDIQSALTVISRQYSASKIQGQPLNLMNTNLSGSFLSSANLPGVNLKGVNLQGAQLTGANLQGAQLTGANLQGAQLTGANLQGAQLTGANLQGAQLVGVNFQHSNLKGANLEKAEMSGTDLQEADVEEANLQGVSLWNSKLQNANFRRANLQNVDFYGANLQKVTLERANLKGANLAGINLLSAYFKPNTTKLNQARFCHTIIPTEEVSTGKVMNRDCKALGFPE